MKSIVPGQHPRLMPLWRGKKKSNRAGKLSPHVPSASIPPYPRQPNPFDGPERPLDSRPARIHSGERPKGLQRAS